MANPVSLSELETSIEDLIEREARRITDETLRPDDITVKRIMERHHVTESQARTIVTNVLTPLVEAGELIRLKCQNPLGGGKIDAWRRK